MPDGAKMSIVVHDGISRYLDYEMVHVAADVMEAAYSGAREIESYAKANAPWTDQTGAARNGLTASVDEEGGEIVITLEHSVDYGIWLETIQDGAFAIIMPTLEALGPRIIKDAGGKVVGQGRSNF